MGLLRPLLFNASLRACASGEGSCVPVSRYAWEVISEWQSRVGGDLGTLLAAAPAAPLPSASRGARRSAAASLRRYNSISCMTQLQAKQGVASDNDSG